MLGLPYFWKVDLLFKSIVRRSNLYSNCTLEQPDADGQEKAQQGSAQQGSGKPHTFVGVKDVNQQKLVRALSAFLKKTGKLPVPEWADVVKLSCANELAPDDSDWYYVRSASLLRHLYVRAPVGVGALTKVYGKLKHRGHRPSHSARCYRGPLRKCLQGLESMGLVVKDEAGGRLLTPQGRRDMDRIAYQVFAEAAKK